MPADVIMPMLGMAQDTGKVLRWLKADGEAVAKGEPLLEVETDKVTVEIEAPAAGTLASVSAAEGAEVPVGTVIAVVLGEREVAEAPVVAAPVGDARVGDARVGDARVGDATPRQARRRLASPKARRLAQERGVDLAAVTGSGPNGAVVAADVEAAERPHPVARQGADGAVSQTWRVMAERTQRSWQEVPHFVLWRDVDASRLLSWRAVAPGKPSVTDLLVKVCAEALRRHPRVNASWRDGTLVPGEHVNVAVAVATGDGLVAPVIHDADRLTLPEISERRREIVEAARAGRLRADDVRDGSFTISNLGMYGVDGFQAIVNAPQAAILAVGRTTERPAVANGELVVRKMTTLSLSFDHRAVDGARGAEFLDTLASLVEEPAGLVV